MELALFGNLPAIKQLNCKQTNSIRAIGIYHRPNLWVTYFVYNSKTNENFEKSGTFSVFLKPKLLYYNSFGAAGLLQRPAAPVSVRIPKQPNIRLSNHTIHIYTKQPWKGLIAASPDEILMAS